VNNFLQLLEGFGMIKLIIFDYDGVLVDSFPCIYDTYKKICANLGKTIPSTIKGFSVIYDHNFLETYAALGILTEQEKRRAEDIYIEETAKQDPQVFAGTKEVLENLSKNYELVIISSNYQWEVEKKIQKNSLIKFFSEIIGKADAEVKEFHKGEAMKSIVKQKKLSFDEVVVIGDRDVDFHTAKEVGIEKVLLVEYGWGYKKGVSSVPFHIHAPKELIKAISFLDKK